MDSMHHRLAFAASCLAIGLSGREAIAQRPWQIFGDPVTGRTGDLVNAGNAALVVLASTRELAIVTGIDVVLQGSFVNTGGFVFLDGAPRGVVGFIQDGEGARRLWWLTMIGTVVNLDAFSGEPGDSGLPPDQFSGLSCGACPYWDEPIDWGSGVPPDFDADGDDNTDLDDFAFFLGCFLGPGVQPSQACTPFDVPGDGNVDLLDFAFFQNSFSGAGPRDSDGDGVTDDVDLCPDTPAGAPVDVDGCAASQLDSDSDGVPDDVDQCPGTPVGTAVGPNGCPLVVCGNGAVETGEQCDDGNTTGGDGCSASCQIEGGGLTNDSCSAPAAVGDGTRTYSNVGATTDGPPEPNKCNFFGRPEIDSDVWFCYTATCTGEAIVSLCGSGYDTKMAVYSGCGCRSAEPLACSDDDCGTGVENTQSRVTFAAVTGWQYMIRVGGYIGAQGDGRLSISCGVDVCASATGDCFTAATERAGCGDPTCCAEVCEVDRFCCDVTWDAFCASEASGFCTTTGFPSCAARAGSCTAAKSTPGCDNVECCNAVCQADPFCCITAWDATCVGRANSVCTNCGRGRGDCFTAHSEPGCSSISCCGKVCATDSFCCDTEWDATCVQDAATLCQ